jgi:hypothetical protein
MLCASRLLSASSMLALLDDGGGDERELTAVDCVARHRLQIHCAGLLCGLDRARMGNVRARCAIGAEIEVSECDSRVR